MKQFPLAEYRVGEALRVGGLCQAYQAELVGMPSAFRVVLKQLLPLFAAEPLVVERWFSKAEENAQLSHPSCARVRDWGWADGSPYLALENVEGKGLKDILRVLQAAGEVLPVDLAVGIARGVLEALAQGHERWPVLSHLDVSPYSVILRPDGSVVLTEFGMWSALEPSDAARVRFDRGRSQYLSPELAWSSAGDTRSDVFSTGALLYELLVGERPFQGATQLVIAMAIADGKRKLVRDHARGAALSPMLCEIVEHMLAHDPANRFQSARAALNALGSAHPLDGSERHRLAALAAPAASGQQALYDSHRAPPMPARSAPKTTFFRARNTQTPVPSYGADAIEELSVTPVLPAALAVGASSDEVPPATPGSMVPLQRTALEPKTSLHLGRVTPARGVSTMYESGGPRASEAPPLVAPPPFVSSAALPGLPSLAPPPMLTPPALLQAPALGAPYGSAPSAPPVQAAGFGPQAKAWIPSAAPSPAWQAPVPFNPPSPIPSAVSSRPAEVFMGSSARNELAPAQAPTFEPLPASPRDDGRWRDPSNTLFQMKNYAAGDTPQVTRKMPLAAAVALAVVFSFALVAGAYLLFRLAQ